MRSVMKQNQKDSNKYDQFKRYLNEMNATVKKLDHSLAKSEHNDHKMLKALHLDRFKNQTLSAHLEDAQKDNKELLNVLQQRCGDPDLSRTTSNIALNSTYSTMSLVNLQYKYDELLAHHNGLLRILESKHSEVRQYQKDNLELRENVERLKDKLNIFQLKIKRMIKKITQIKERKTSKILRLKAERNTLREVHNQLADILHKQCMEKDEFLHQQLKTTPESDKAQLLQEIRKNNILTYENFQLQQEINYLRSILKVTPSSSKEKISI